MYDVINFSDEKAKRQSIFNIEAAESDVAKYEDVVMKSVRDFHTYSAQEKYELYSSLAEFNVKILKQLLERKRND